MASEPWRDWIPGVLAPDQVKELAGAGYLEGARFDKSPPDLSSFDLHLSDEVWILDTGSVKPVHHVIYSVFLEELGKRLVPTDGAVRLEPKKTYVFKVRERLQGLGPKTGIHGQATAKSSVGRVDVLARLIVDGMDGYEEFHPTEHLKGSMYLEVTPMTFPVRVRIGTSLSQLRLFYGHPDICTMRGDELARTISSDHDLMLHVDLAPVKIGSHEVVAFRAKPSGSKPIALWVEQGALPNPSEHWAFCRSTPARRPKEPGRLQLKEDAFYILRSKERLALTGGVAAYCRAIDETIGEMRIHYAGFVHPWFGRDRDDSEIGTPLIFEVRGHDLSVNLLDGEVMARMTIYRMSQDIPKPERPQSYSKQQLELSKFFGPWPKSIHADDDGNVTER